jgi:hypothetical protein
MPFRGKGTFFGAHVGVFGGGDTCYVLSCFKRLSLGGRKGRKEAYF